MDSQRTSFVYSPDQELLRKFEFLGIASLWQRKKLSEEDYKEAERIARKMLADPYCEDWNVLARLHSYLHRRGLALLPFWNALQHDVPLALTMAIVLEIMLPKENDSRSFVFSLARYKAWRWDFISVAELVRVLKLVHKFLICAGLNADFAENNLLAILDLDVTSLRPVFKTKIAYALLLSNLLKGKDLTWIPDRIKGSSDPFLVVSRNTRDIPNKLSDLLRRDPTGARNQLRGAESPEFIGSDDIQEKIIDLLEICDAEALKFAHACGVFQSLSVNKHVDAYLRAVILADYAWARGYALAHERPQLLIGLAGKKMFFKVETIYAVNEQWTAWATSFACAMATAYGLQTK